ncbi:MAG: protein-glutamate methylesterase/protein-glutamine glutaminase [Gammaproteobacteria bacterium]
MPVRVLVVDDSGFFRRRLCEILSGDALIEVVGTAVDGADAVKKVSQLQPDVITMDIEMPVMDGITAVRRIMASRPTPVLMFSSLTHDGAQATLNALEAGALDFLPKQFEDIAKDREEAKQLLCSRVRALARKQVVLRPALAANAAAVSGAALETRSTVARPVAARPALAAVPKSEPLRRGQHQIIVIGTSTGGPVALQQVLTKLPANFPLPILLVQHMPASFTPAFAQRLDQMCALSVKQADDGDTLAPGTALLAPGGRQLLVEQRGGLVRARVIDGDPGLHYRPSVDITFASVAKAYSARALALVLTGMGADGREGARLLKQGGATVWTQDEASCVIYGMPAAVVEAGLSDRVLPLSEIGPTLAGSV